MDNKPVTQPDEVPEDLKDCSPAVLRAIVRFHRIHEHRLRQQVAALTAERDDTQQWCKEYDGLYKPKVEELQGRLNTAEACCERLGCLLTGRDREETADKIFAVAQGRMNTRSVWILADELMLAARAEQAEARCERLERPVSDGVSRIAAERKRQIEVESWTLEHDRGHRQGELAIQAAALAIDHTDACLQHPDCDEGEAVDPFGLAAKHHLKTQRALEIAGALIAAELDRIAARAKEQSHE